MPTVTGLDDVRDGVEPPDGGGPWARIALAKSSPATDRPWVDPEPQAPPGDSTLVGQILGGRYRVESHLGFGGMGTRYLASDLLAGDTPLSVTLLRPEFRSFSEALALLRVEVRVTRMLRHPQIARVYSLNTDRLGIYLVTEYLVGQTLETALERTGHGLPVSAVRQLFDDACAALAYAHELDVVHGDLRPANVFLSPTGRAKLLDFGLARAAGTRNGRFDARRIDGLTLAYASAEMLQGRVPDPRDDVYSLACLLYTALAGAHPFESRSALEAQRLALTVAPLAVLSPAENTALAGALAFDGVQRTPSVTALREGLGWVMAPEPPAIAPAPAASPRIAARVPARPSSRPQRPTQPRATRVPRRYLVAAAGVLVLVAAGIGSALLYQGHAVTVVMRSPPAINPAPVMSAPVAPPPAPTPAPTPAPIAPPLADSVTATPPHAEAIVETKAVNGVPAAQNAAGLAAALPILRPLSKAAAAMADSDNCPYPREAVDKGLTGTVWLWVYVTADGRPTQTKLDKTSGSDVLDQAALRCVEQFGRFPAPPGGSPSAGYPGRVRFKWSFGT